MLVRSFSCKTAQYSTSNCIQQDYSVGDAFWGAIPTDNVVFDTAIVTEIHLTEYVELTDVGGVFQLKDCTIPAYVYGVPGYACYSSFLGRGTR
jgi:hypothetical protein